MHKLEWLEGQELVNCIGNEPNLTATIYTKYGPTRTISTFIKDSIRQEGVLSVIEYANLIDDISQELHELTIGNQKLWNIIPGCLLRMDDVALIHHDKEEFRRMLNTTSELENRYHIKFVKEKSQSMTINGQKTNTEITMRTNTKNKYIQLSIYHHKITRATWMITQKKIEGKTEAALQMIFTLAGNEEFHNIEIAQYGGCWTHV